MKIRIPSTSESITFRLRKLSSPFLKDRVIAKDLAHSKNEERYYCFGKIEENIITVRFTYRNNKIRIIGAGYWRKGKQIYEKENKIHE